MRAKSILEPWKSLFTEIDNSIREELVLHCLGGFVLLMLYGLDRPTAKSEDTYESERTHYNEIRRFATGNQRFVAFDIRVESILGIYLRNHCG